MGQQKYTDDDTIWRNGVPYPATSRNLRRSRKSFLKEQEEGGYYHSRHRRQRKMTKEEQEIIRDFMRFLLLGIVWIFCVIFVFVGLIFLSIVFIIGFTIKVIFLSAKRISDKKVNIFKINNGERKVCKSMSGLILWLENFTSKIVKS